MSKSKLIEDLKLLGYSEKQIAYHIDERNTFDVWRPITIQELMDMDESQYEDVLSYVWKNGQERCDDVGISDVVIEKSKYNEGDYYVYWSDMNGDPSIEGYPIDTLIDNIGDGTWNYGLYVKKESDEV